MKQEIQPRYHSEIYEWLRAAAGVVTVLVLICTFLVRPVMVSGVSMQPTLREGDLMLLGLLPHTPQRGDIVVMQKQEFSEQAFVKRVIAVEGDVVDIDFRTGAVTVNGEVLDEPYINEATHAALDWTGPQTVPEGCLFVMGDNRNHSNDSRDARIGMVDERCVIGNVWTVLRLPFSLGGDS